MSVRFDVSSHYIFDCSLRFMEDLSRDSKRGMAEGLSVDDVERMLLVLQQGGLEKLVRSAHELLRREDGYRARGVSTPSSAGLSQTISDVLFTPGNLRSTRVVSGTISSLAHRLRDKVPGSQNFGKQRSTWFDLAHCSAGGAYCDVFTCDGQTAEHLILVRRDFGLHPPLALQAARSPKRLVEMIEEQLGKV